MDVLPFTDWSCDARRVGRYPGLLLETPPNLTFTCTITVLKKIERLHDPVSMIWKSSQKRTSSARCTSFEDLNEDVLRLILDEVRCIGKKECIFNVCLISRRLYALAASHLYRAIELDFSRSSHRRLLHRLVNPNTHLPRMIRGLSLVDVNPSHYLQLQEIRILLLRLTNFSHLIWSGAFDVPKILLERLNDRFPKALLTVHVRKAGPD